MKPQTVTHNLESDVRVTEPLSQKPSSAYKGLRFWFVVAVCAQLLLFAGFAAPKAYTLATGKEVVLKTVPVDPYDMFRGEYAALGYDKVSTVTINKAVSYGDDVYVVLEHRGDHWISTAAGTERPATSPGQVVLKGKIISSWTNNGESRIDYGISRLFMPEGRSAELQNRANSAFVTVAVDSFGNACIKRVTVDGQQIYDGTSWFNPFQ
jgi:uncharacterized membrane-anchored protein